MSALKPICVPCKRFFRMTKAGFTFLEGMPKPGEGRPEPGTGDPDRWQPYKLWSGDKWECDGCGSEIVVGVGQRPIAEHFQEAFAAIVKQFCRCDVDAAYQVNDC